jgi:hypothetical protein
MTINKLFGGIFFEKKELIFLNSAFLLRNGKIFNQFFRVVLLQIHFGSTPLAASR